MGREIADIANVIAPDADYPSGRIKNATGPSIGDGTPVIEELHGDFIQAIWKAMRDNYFVANTLPDNVTNGFQIYQSMMAATIADVGFPFGSETTFGSSGSYTSPTRIFCYKGKVYTLDNGIEIKVASLEDGTYLSGENFGSGDLTAAKDFFIYDDKAYVTDVTEVKVFDITDGTYLSGENFGSGDLTAAEGIYIVGVKAYVVDSSDQEVHVFNKSTLAAIPGDDFGSGTLASAPTKIQISDNGLAWVLDGTTIRVYNVLFGSAKAALNITGMGSANDFALYGNRARIVVSTRVETWDINAGGEMAAFEWDDSGNTYLGIDVYNGKVILSGGGQLQTPGDGYLIAPTVHKQF